MLRIFTPLNWIFLLHTFFHKTVRKISTAYWQYIATAYLLYKNVKLPMMKPRFYGRTLIHIDDSAKVIFGDNLIVRSSATNSIDNTPCSKIQVNKGAVLKIGDMTGWSNTVILCYDSITIGNHVNIGAGCMIFDTNFHSTDWHDREDRRLDVSNAKTAPIVIGDYVFIGTRSIIMKGVSIGEKTMISAGSVVVKDIPANCIAGGNPCRVIKMLE